METSPKCAHFARETAVQATRTKALSSASASASASTTPMYTQRPSLPWPESQPFRSLSTIHPPCIQRGILLHPATELLVMHPSRTAADIRKLAASSLRPPVGSQIEAMMRPRNSASPLTSGRLFQQAERRAHGGTPAFRRSLTPLAWSE